METLEKRMPVTGREGHEIDIETAAAWTRNYRERHPDEAISQFFGRELYQRILDQPDCLGIRIYYANSERLSGFQRFVVGIANFLTKKVAGAEGVKHVILAGVTAEGRDMLPGWKTGASDNNNSKTFRSLSFTSSGTDSTSGTLVEQALPCPGSAGCPQNALTGS